MSDKRIDLTHDFDLSFGLLMGNKVNAGDGMAFVLHNDPLGNNALGKNGGGLGAAGLLNGLAIQFDTWQNTKQGDIAAKHTDIVTTDPQATTYRLGGQVALNNLTDGNWHSVDVHWNAATQTLTYTFDGEQVGQLQLTPTQFATISAVRTTSTSASPVRPAAIATYTRSSSIRSMRRSSLVRLPVLRTLTTAAFSMSPQSAST